LLGQPVFALKNTPPALQPKIEAVTAPYFSDSGPLKDNSLPPQEDKPLPPCMSFFTGERCAFSPRSSKMKCFQDECVSVSKYASLIGKSRRTVHRYIALGMPVVKGTYNPIHVPSANEWWQSRIQGRNPKEAQDG
jgi:hypothetical protein